MKTPHHEEDTSWENSAKPYHELVGNKGSYYHQHIIFPRALALLNLTGYSSLLELGCGQGVFSRVIPENITYFGLDKSPTLIALAKSMQKKKPLVANVVAPQDEKKPYFKIQDVSVPFKLAKTNFTHAVIILALQNMPSFETAIANASAHLKPGGKLLIVLNHPSFRIPKHSSWVMEPYTQSRRIHRYMEQFSIPIDMTPGSQDQATMTWSFHAPLSAYSAVFYKHNLLIEKIEEWVSDKTSVGKNADRENKARAEFPLFMGILLVKRD